LESKILAELNGHRRLFGAGPLIRLETLDIGAKAANDKMQKAGVAKKDASIKHGQLQCIKLTSSGNVPAECLSLWLKQMQDYDWSKPAIKENTRLFATAVYRASTHAGVAVKKGPSGRYFVFVLLDPAPDAAKLKDNVKGYSGKKILAFITFRNQGHLTRILCRTLLLRLFHGPLKGHLCKLRKVYLFGLLVENFSHRIV